MENQNPLESLRDAVLESQLLGIDNGIAQLGVSDDIIKICNALDIYYGIKREGACLSTNNGAAHDPVGGDVLVRSEATE